ncbi:ribokinase [uncultured Desulfobulbus sp.]|uniref:ribokinase n=1 Tax=uncultured Desulfobulbus sp. TaxID=239745 RepID=UPI0029C73C30|nr:ribokinase [uncultured Desulfobulbus sp.]
MKSKIIVVGSTNTDMIINVPILPAPGQTVVGSDFKILPGGKGANQAVAAVRLGADVTFISSLGCDSFGDESMSRLSSEGIDTQYIVRKPDVHSGTAMIFVDASGENVIAVSPGANGLLTPNDVISAKNAFTEKALVILQLEIPMETVLATAKMAKQMGHTVVLNPAPMSSDGLPDELLQYVNILTPNKGELMQIAPDADNVDVAVHLILTKGPSAVVVTMGKDGAKAFDSSGSVHVKAIEVMAIDTVGAGDCFTAALGVSIADGASLEDALLFGVTASGLSTLVCGAQEGMPTLINVESRISR